MAASRISACAAMAAAVASLSTLSNRAYADAPFRFISFSSSSPQTAQTVMAADGNWTPRQNKLFEEALALYSKDTPDRWEKIASAVNGKSAEQVKVHYEILIEDLRDIENGRVPFPNYRSTEDEG